MSSSIIKSSFIHKQEARKRATTVYLADRRYDMLPPVLSSQLCSLLGSVERSVIILCIVHHDIVSRYAVSCIWEIHHTTFKVSCDWSVEAE